MPARRAGRRGGSPARPEAEVARGIGQDAKLALGGGDYALVAVAGVDAPEAREAVDERAPLGVGHGRVLGGGEQPHARGLVPAPARDGVNEMGAVEFDQRIGKHGKVSSRVSRAPGRRGRSSGTRVWRPEPRPGSWRCRARPGRAPARRASPEAARLRDIDAEEGAGAACEEEGEQAPRVGGVAGDDRAATSPRPKGRSAA